MSSIIDQPNLAPGGGNLLPTSTPTPTATATSASAQNPTDRHLPFNVQQVIRLIEQHRSGKLQPSQELGNIVSVPLTPQEFTLLSLYLWKDQSQANCLIRPSDPNKNSVNAQATPPAAPSVSSSSQPHDTELGAYVLDELIYSYSPRQSCFEIRIMTILHDEVGNALAALILDSATRAASGHSAAAEDVIQKLEVRRSPSAASYLCQTPNDEGGGGGGYTTKFSDGMIGVKGNPNIQSLSIEVDYSSNKGRDKIKEFIAYTVPVGHARAGIVLDVAHRTPSARLSTREPPDTATASLFRREVAKGTFFPREHAVVPAEPGRHLRLRLGDLSADMPPAAADIPVVIEGSEIAGIVADAAAMQAFRDQQKAQLETALAESSAAAAAAGHAPAALRDREGNVGALNNVEDSEDPDEHTAR